MANFIKLADSVINLDWIRQIKFSPDPPIAWIFWAIGCEDIDVAGEDALLLMDAVDNQSVTRRSVLDTENEPENELDLA